MAEGILSVEDTEVTIKRAPEIMSEDLARRADIKINQRIPISTVNEWPKYDVIIFGTPTRFSNIYVQVRNFFDQIDRLWLSGDLTGKISSVFTSTGTQHRGQKIPITSLIHTIFIAPRYDHSRGFLFLPGDCVLNTPLIKSEFS
ncbi:hypothetical protein [Nitrosomonas supralitoralis]|uniref:hypothetical protein n=1 Tax=Nitrosomonas supralitoralis TaxID=2116706 RepID=UPI001F5B1581|nr:hypothetical protein [Nitrosomonas supralitoralis]